MAVLSSANNSTSILKALQVSLPGILFSEGASFYWSPKRQTVIYNKEALTSSEGVWSLLHETAHGMLGHTTYDTDFELLSLEVTAWEQAKKLSKDFDTIIDENYIQDCLDTYRDWLHRRSMCPTCGSIGLQRAASEYRCHNCNGIWHVSTARFCRAYRRKASSTKEKSPSSLKNQTTFQ